MSLDVHLADLGMCLDVHLADLGMCLDVHLTDVRMCLDVHPADDLLSLVCSPSSPSDVTWASRPRQTCSPSLKCEDNKTQIGNVLLQNTLYR